jgi:ARMET, C-terminal
VTLPFITSYSIESHQITTYIIVAALKVEKVEGGSVDYNSMKVKQLKTLLDQRGVRCSGCTEKSEFVKRCQETENLDL